LKNSNLFGSVLITIGVFAIAPANGQENTSAEDGERDQFVLEEIVVTAQKTEENLQDVPISVGVLQNQTIERLGMTKLDELSRYLPNFQVQKSGSTTLISIRGIGSGGNRGFEQSVGMFVDGVFAGREQQFAVPFFDLERVEVLKGTQSILFGKNTIAGAVNVTTARPTDTFESSLTGYYETEHGEYRVSGVISGPLSDSFRARLAVRTSEGDGYLFNTLVDKDGIESEETLVRLSGEWEPTGNVLVRAKYESAETERAGSPFQLVSFGGAGGLFASFDPDVESNLDLRNSSGVFNDGFTEITSDNATVQIEYGIGDFTLTSVTGYSAFESASTDDSDFSPVPLIGFAETQDYDQFSQEIRLDSPADEQFAYTVGAYYQDASYFTNPRFDLRGDLLGAVRTGNRRLFDQDATVWSVFAEGTVHLSDNFRVIAGLRYTDEDKEALKSNTIVVFGTDTPETNPMILGLNAVAFGTFNFSENLSRNESDTSPALTFQYDFGDDEMAYFKATRGFKSGGFDVSDRSGESLEYEGEEANSFEAGLKSGFADGRAEINAAIFHTKFEDLQVSAFDGLGFITTNAAEATSQGVEVDGRWQIAAPLMFTGSLAYTDASFDSYDSAPCTVEQDAVWMGPGDCRQDLSGRPLLSAPEWSANINLRHTADFGNGWGLDTNLGLNYLSDHYVATDLSAASLQDSYVTVDASVTLLGGDDRWNVGLVARNLGDERAKAYVVNVPIFSGARSAFVIPPRTVAINGTVRF
jgi:outer membrane receptor protein involved in Fe transport